MIIVTIRFRTTWIIVSYCTDAGNSCASMPELGYLDKNDELINSIAKATLATTSIIGVPWRRRTMDFWELAFGSNASLIPSELQGLSSQELLCMDPKLDGTYLSLPLWQWSGQSQRCYGRMCFVSHKDWWLIV